MIQNENAKAKPFVVDKIIDMKNEIKMKSEIQKGQMICKNS